MGQFEDFVMAEAEKGAELDPGLVEQPDRWRVALVQLLNEVRADLSQVNAEMKALNPRHERARLDDLAAERVGMIDRQRLLDDRLSLVKPLCSSVVRPTDSEDAVEQAIQLLYAALGLLRDVVAEKKA